MFLFYEFKNLTINNYHKVNWLRGVLHNVPETVIESLKLHCYCFQKIDQSRHVLEKGK